MSENKKHLYYLHSYDFNNFKKKKKIFYCTIKNNYEISRNYIYIYTHL